MYKILIIDDDTEVMEARAIFLYDHGCMVHKATGSAEAIALLCENNYDAVLLDIMMPEISGFDLAREIIHLSKAPIIFLSSLEDTESQIHGFDVGGSDYITKDCPLDLFWSKIETRIKLSKHKEVVSILSFPPMEIDLKKRIVTIEKQLISLTSVELNLLVYLASHSGKILTVEDIYRELWGTSSDVDSQLVQSHMSRMRRKLEKAFTRHGFIETVWGKGYQFVPMDN